MKLHEIFYIAGIFFIIISIIIFVLATTYVTNREDNTASNLFGKTVEFDSTFSSAEAFADLQEHERYRNAIFLWIGIPTGVFLVLFGIFLKRKNEGPDLFLDDDIEDDEENDLLLG